MNIQNKIKQKSIFLILSYFFFISLWFFFSNGSPFLALYENGFDKFLNFIIQSETKGRVDQLINALDKDFFKIMVAFLFYNNVFIVNKFKKNYFLK